MERIDHPTAVAGKFVEGDATVGQSPTVVTGKHMNNEQEELCNLIEGRGIALDGNDNTQLTQAVASFITELLANPAEFLDLLTSKKLAIKGDGPIAALSALNNLPMVFETSGAEAMRIEPDGTLSIGGANQYSNSGSGWVKMPGGLILQWGYYSPNAPTNTDIPITLPIAFPTAFWAAFATTVCASSGSNAWASIVNNWTNASINVVRDEVSGLGAAGGFFWFAIGA